MKMPDRERERGIAKDTQEGARETKERQGDRERWEANRRLAVTKAEFNHPKHAAEWSGEEGSIEYHDLKSAIGQIENANRAHPTLPGISLSC